MKKVLALTVIVLVCVGGIAAYSISKGSFPFAQNHLENGKKAFGEKKYEEAAIHFANALQKDERDRDARFFLAKTSLAQGNPRAAVQYLQSLLAIFPDDTEANLELGNLLLTAGAADPQIFKLAAESAQKILDKDPNNVPALILSGNAAVGLQDFKTSNERHEKAISLDPRNTSALLSFGKSQVIQKNNAEAEKIFLKARELNPGEPNVVVALGQFYDFTGQFEKAEAAFKDALAMAPDKDAVYLPAVAMYLRWGKVEKGEAILKDAQARNPDRPEPSFALYNIYQGRRLPEEAEKLLLELRRQFPDNPQVALKFAGHYLQTKPELARTTLDELLKKEPHNQQGLILLGEVQYLTGQYAEAQATLSTPEAVNSPFPQPHFFLGSLAAKKGRFDVARDEFQKSISLDPRYLAARLALADLYLSRNTTGAARAEISKVLELQPNLPAARLIKAGIDRIDKKYPEAERELLSLVKEQPNNPLIHRQLALYFEDRGKTADAEKSFLRAVETQPDSPEILQDAAMFYLRLKQVDRAIQLIDQSSAGKRQAFHDELAGRVYSQVGKAQEAEVSFKKAVEKEPGRISAINSLATIYFVAGRNSEALTALDDSLKRNPSQPKALATRAVIYEGSGKIEEAKKDYTLALEGDPNIDTAANNLAYLLAQEGRDFPTALKWAQVARTNQPDSPSTADTLGWVHYKMGSYDLAREQLEIAISKQPESGVYHYHLGMILKAAQKTADAQAAFRKAAASTKDTKEKGLAQAELKQSAAKP